MVEQIKTGIKGLDTLLRGGFPKGNNILLAGTAGAGKSLFCLEYLYRGATEFNEPGVYVSLEERPEDIKKNVAFLGWDIDALEKSKKIAFVKYEPFKTRDVFEYIDSVVREIGAKRVVIDSITVLTMTSRVDDPRAYIWSIGWNLKRIGCTTLFTCEVPPEKKNALSRDGYEEFMADGVVVLYYQRMGSSFTRNMAVWKMRGIDHDRKLHPYEISKTGINIYPEEEGLVEDK